MEKMKFAKAELELTEFSQEDVITTSGNFNADGNYDGLNDITDPGGFDQWGYPV